MQNDRGNNYIRREFIIKKLNRNLALIINIWVKNLSFKSKQRRFKRILRLASNRKCKNSAFKRRGRRSDYHSGEYGNVIIKHIKNDAFQKPFPNLFDLFQNPPMRRTQNPYRHY
uniref:Uncharacterized protein n=1 Tax=Euplotes harpa TaxID=151035 RepID=A0A7S3JCB5_9SPIT